MNANRKHRNIAVALIAAIVLGNVIGPVLAAQMGGGTISDARLKKGVDSTELKYLVHADGYVKILIGLDDDRSQMVIISSKTSSYRSLEKRELTSAVALLPKSKVTIAMLLRLMSESNTMKFGSYVVEERSSGQVLIKFNATVSPDAGARELKAAIALVAMAADRAERWIATDDTF